MDLPMLGVMDYVVIGLSLLFCVGIGLLAGRGGSKGTDKVANFLLANRQLGMFPAAVSIMATVFSSNAIAGNIGEYYVYGITNSIYFIGATAVKIFAAFYIIPVFHNLPYTSIYEYLEARFDRPLRIIFAILYILCNYIYLGTVLYGPAISLSTVTNIPYWINAALLGSVCTLYCVLGGMKAVVWTDVFQAFLMFACVMMVAIQGIVVAGFENVFIKSGTTMGKSFIFTEDLGTRYSIWGVFISSTLATFKTTIAGQAGAQRLLAVKDHHVARRSVYVSCAMMIVFDAITVVCGLVIYALFADCDPLQRKEETGVRTPDQVFIYAVSKLVGSIPGLQGLALAGLLSASLSTCSSYINSFATIALQDIIKVFCPSKATNENTNIKICKMFTILFGVLTVLISFTVPFMGGIVKVTKGVAGAVLGPLSGIMVTAFFFPRVNASAAKISLIIGIVVTSWLTLGSVMNPTKYQTLPLSTECPLLELANATVTDQSLFSYSEGDLTTTPWAPTVKPNTSVFPLYAISFVWYGPLGMALTCGIALLISLFSSSSSYPDERLLSPLVNKKINKWGEPNPSTIKLDEMAVERKDIS